MKIITAWAEPAHGPGWANWPIWYIVCEDGGKLTRECLQPGQQTEEMHTLYHLCATAHAALLAAVERAGMTLRLDTNFQD